MHTDTIRVPIQDIFPSISKKISEGGSVEMTVAGNSMRPTLLDRVSKVRLTAIKVPKRGDMVLYRRENGTFVLHRIVRTCHDGTIIFCGDSQYQFESGIRREQLLAVVYEFFRRKKWVSCDDLIYQFWWRLCIQMCCLRHASSVIRQKFQRLNDKSKK